MELCNAIINGLNSMITDYGDAVMVRLGYPTEITVKIGPIVGIPHECSLLLLTYNPASLQLDLQPNDAANGLLEFLNEKLKNDLDVGNIGRIPSVLKSYFSDSPPKNSQRGSAHSSIRSVGLFPSSHYKCMYEELGNLGKGGYGLVTKCRHRVDGMTYAVKKIPFNEDSEDKVIQEAKIMAELHHPNIIRYHQSWTEEGYEQSRTADGSLDTDSPSPPTKTLYVAMECCHGTLEGVIGKPLDKEKIAKYFGQLFQGLTYIHEKGVLHRDLSKQNIMLDSKGDIKIGDFGLAILFDGAADGSSKITSGPVGNVSYRAPEMTRSPTCISNKTDNFSLGLILFEIIHPMKTESERAKTFDSIRNGSLDWSKINLGSNGVIRHLLEVDPSKRISTNEVLEVSGKS